LTELGLYKSHNVQWHDAGPFQTIEVVKVENGIVSFTTEWPVQELDCYEEEFNKRFYKW